MKATEVTAMASRTRKTKISVTDLDQLLWFDRLESMTVEDLVSRLRRETKPEPHMLAGRAWHDLLEHHEGGELAGTIQHNDFTFTIDAEATIELPQVRELRGYSMIHLPGRDIILSGRLDGMTGNALQDYKLTARINPENYWASSQWRAYCHIFGCEALQYTLFQKNQRGFNVTINEVYPFTFYRYPGMLDDLTRSIRAFLDFVDEYMPGEFDRTS
jgi:hypothetical protein